MMLRRILACIVLICLPHFLAAQEITWPVDQYDPAQKDAPEAAADLILPLPCGGAMAFQKVVIPVDTESPLSDRQLRLGQSDAQTGYADYFVASYLRGPFSDTEGDTHFYIARYELTDGQFKALSGTCPEARGRDRFAKGGLSWFEAVALSQTYTEWLMQNARDALPLRDEAAAFVRLPTEEEWEYATRGGVAIEATEFPARRFTGEDPVSDFARVLSSGGRARIGAVGTRKPNPLGLFDVYGNAEELMLEPFRLNAIGREHGQPGGLVTRGGSFKLTEDQIYSAQRAEYGFYDRNGAARASDSFGLRFVLSAPVLTSDPRLSNIRDAWVERSTREETTADDPLGQLTRLIENEIDPRRKAALGGLQADLRLSREAAETARKETAKSALLSGGIFLPTLDANSATIGRLRFNIGNLTEIANVSPEEERARLMRAVEGYVEDIVDVRRAQASVLLTFRSVVDTLVADVPPDEAQASYELLRRELTAGQQTEILRLVDRFWEDLNAYRETPDMTQVQLESLALSQ
ncbi:MAG: SUMF1/EgtB/PvdO family nonheme iron enzyme [Pseudomonadota bacterium]